MATATAPPVTPKTSVSADPIWQQALAQAKTALNAEAAPVQQEQAQSDASYAAQAQGATDASTALSGLLKGIGPAVSQTYTTAAQNQDLAAQGFSAGVRDALQGNTDNLNAMLKSLAPNVNATIDSHAPQVSDVIYGLGGYNPSSAMNREGAAFSAAADLLPSQALEKGAQDAASLKAQGLLKDQTFQNQLATIAAKLPGQALDNYSKLQSLALSNKKFQLAVQNQKFTQAMKIAQQKLAVTKFNADQQYKAAQFNADQQYKAAQLKLSAQRVANAQFNADRSYQIRLANLGIAQRKMQMQITANAFKAANGGYTPKELNKIQIQAMGLAHSYYEGSSVTKGYSSSTTKTGSSSGTGTEVRTTQTNTAGLTYQAALSKMMQKGIPVQIALRALDSVYPKAQQLNASGLDAYLGPLTPENIAAASQQLHAQGAAAVGNAAGFGFNPYVVDTASMKNLSAKGKTVVSGVMQLAQEYLGTPYLWGGESPKGFDCSGLAQFIYGKEGVSIPRTSEEQFTAPNGLNVPRNQLMAGDLVFFKGSDSQNGLPGHVGIYIGSGKFIEAPHTGAVVRVSTLSGYPGYMGARRFVK